MKSFLEKLVVFIILKFIDLCKISIIANYKIMSDDGKGIVEENNIYDCKVIKKYKKCVIYK